MGKRRWIELVVIFVASIVVPISLFLWERTPLYEALDADIANSFLATVAQVLAGILAIVFSLSVLAVEISSDRYTPRLFSYFARDRTTWLTFLLLLGCVLISVVAIGIQTIPMYRWGFLAISWLFVLCLLMMLQYFRQVLWLLNPRNLAARILDESRRAVKKQDHPGFFGTVTSLGDMAVKAFERGEDEIARTCLDSLFEIQQTLIGAGLTPAFKTGEEFAAGLFGFGIVSPVVDQCYRLFRRAAEEKSEELTRHIASLVSAAIIDLVGQDGRDQLLRGILLQQYQKFVEIAIEHKDTCRFLLMRNLREALFYGQQVRNEKYLDICLAALQRANRAIINYQDFDLWKNALHDFSKIPSVEDAYGSLRLDLPVLLDHLFDQTPVHPGKWRIWQKIALELEHAWITPAKDQLLEHSLSEIEQLIPESKEELREEAQKVRKSFQQLRAVTKIYNAFFVTSIDSFYIHRYEYIKELWQHVNPPDASAYSGNASLIYLDIGFLTHQMIFTSALPWEIEGYHGAEIYILQYYLLCLAYALQHPISDWYPPVPCFSRDELSGDNEYSSLLGQELRASYTLLIDLPYHADQVLTQYEAIVCMANEWDDVFRGKATKALEKAKEWFEDAKRRQVWKERADSLVQSLPLDNRRVEAYQEAAKRTYEAQSQVHLLAMPGSDAGLMPASLVGKCHTPPCLDKLEFTLIAFGKPEETPAQVDNFQAITCIIRDEMAYLTDTLLAHDAIESIKIEQLTFDSVVQAVEKINEAGYEATALVIPHQQFFSALQYDSNFQIHDIHEGKERYLGINDHSRLRIVAMDSDKDCVFIMDKQNGAWTAIKPLQVEVTECDTNPLAVQVIVQEIVDYQIANPEAVKILRIAPVGL
ncbi:MAG: DUF2254 domain-containing protein [Anaerolineae bacterium]|nr:DUF2254 domain-containing protein [Anaerolineae bacterium]